MSSLTGGRSGAQQSQPGSGLSGGVGGTWTTSPGAQKTGTPVWPEGPPATKARAHRCKGKRPTATAGEAVTRHGCEGPSCCRTCSEPAQGSRPQGQGDPLSGAKLFAGQLSRASVVSKEKNVVKQDQITRLTGWLQPDTGCAPGLLLCLSEGQHIPTRGKSHLFHVFINNSILTLIPI